MASNSSSLDYPGQPVPEAPEHPMQPFADRLKDIADAVCGSSHLLLRDLHADMLATIRDRERPAPAPRYRRAPVRRVRR